MFCFAHRVNILHCLAAVACMIAGLAVVEVAVEEVVVVVVVAVVVVVVQVVVVVVVG